MSKTRDKHQIIANGSLHCLPLSELHVDHSNPRFGGAHLSARDEKKVVDEIVGQHGIIDVLSSIAANAYFESEPLVGAINKGHGDRVTVVEGNRRLTACFVLAGEERADKHRKLRAQYPKSKLDEDVELPVQVYDWKNREHRARLIPYLGVRHIVGAQQWDSYAKAAWVVAALEGSDLTLEDIKSMIGDDQNFTDRIVEGYYFVRQLKETNSYDVAGSVRRGRGSLQVFSFSWVYTALGYRNIRDFVGLPKESVLKKDPVDDTHLESAGDLMQFMFGGGGKHAAIDDSREIGSLARALSRSEAAAVLRKGGSLGEALDATRPPEELLIELLGRADKSLADGVRIASGLRPLERSVYGNIRDAAEKVDGRLDSLFSIMDTLGPAARKRRGEAK
jgi:hypothetical protein